MILLKLISLPQISEPQIPTKEIDSLIEYDEEINVDDLHELVGEYLYTDRLPRVKQIIGMLDEKPRILEYQGIVDRIKGAISEAVEIFKW
jgi:hypothetical protein